MACCICNIMLRSEAAAAGSFFYSTARRGGPTINNTVVRSELYATRATKPASVLTSS